MFCDWAFFFPRMLACCRVFCTSNTTFIILTFPLRLTDTFLSPRSPAQSRSELIIAPPPPWPFACNERSTPEKSSTSVVAAFITPKQPNVEEALKKPTNESTISQFRGKKPPAAADSGDVVNDTFDQRQESGSLFLEEDDSKYDSIKRCPSG